jgi:hypothetical protein
MPLQNRQYRGNCATTLAIDDRSTGRPGDRGLACANNLLAGDIKSLAAHRIIPPCRTVMHHGMAAIRHRQPQSGLRHDEAPPPPLSSRQHAPPARPRHRSPQPPRSIAANSRQSRPVPTGRSVISPDGAIARRPFEPRRSFAHHRAAAFQAQRIVALAIIVAGIVEPRHQEAAAHPLAALET